MAKTKEKFSALKSDLNIAGLAVIESYLFALFGIQEFKEMMYIIQGGK